MTEIPHFDFPFRRDPDSGKVIVTEHDSPAHITAQEYAVVVTPTGTRPERPDFGWDWPEFSTIPLNLGPLEDALRRFVPDSDVQVTQWADAAQAAVQHVQIRQLMVQGSGTPVNRTEAGS
jgi:phage baseplate assembly protein W